MQGNFGKLKPAPRPLPEAIEIVLGRLPSPRIGRVPVGESLGATLAVEVSSDVDMPPFDRCAMDGFAVRAADTAQAPVALQVTGEVAAGSMARCEVGPGQSVKVMTGAPLPPGADAVQMVERTRMRPDGRVEILEAMAPGEHVSRRGEDLRAGTRVLSMGSWIGAAEVGLLAAVGQAEVPVFLPPRVAVLATGNELVGPDRSPAEGQIRNSNGPALGAAARAEGCPVEDLGIAKDDAAHLADAIARGLEADVFLLSGGVSMGEHDLVDGALRSAGVELHLESVAIKPGKPMVFGTHPRGTVVFGLPGNPLSCLVGFTLFVAPAIRTLRRTPRVHAPRVRATILGVAKGDRKRRSFVRGSLKLDDGRFTCEPVSFHGSADLPAFTRGNALIEVPEGRTRVESGESAWVLLDEAFLRR